MVCLAGVHRRAAATLPSPDGTYNVIVQVADKSGNIGQATQKVILDRTGPTLTPSLSAPNNRTFYDVGTPIALTWTATDLNGVQSIARVEGQTISSSGGTIDVDVLTSGAHTVTITSRDNAGNVTTKTITFTIHATAKGILNTINDGAPAARSPPRTRRRSSAIDNVINAPAAARRSSRLHQPVQSATPARSAPRTRRCC